ncbi:hypothetical protein BLNAU_18484 [Blattamonas nauphoetae]|uniref:Uncharacterized protein n=1 Tax=Blattamonas nauphoetae TaxID=2049346 RepID=A0ABQ9X8K7_9EUKA|nr:hypothetical protein BLNAU_18484 [Blattamonas nauphoetae]
MPIVKASNNLKTVSDTIKKNDGLDELPHSLETIKMISPSRFDGVVYPREFVIITNSQHGCTGPMWDDLSLDVLPLEIGMQFVQQLREGHNLEAQLLFHQQLSEDNINRSMIAYLDCLSQFHTDVLNQQWTESNTLSDFWDEIGHACHNLQACLDRNHQRRLTYWQSTQLSQSRLILPHRSNYPSLNKDGPHQITMTATDRGVTVQKAVITFHIDE